MKRLAKQLWITLFMLCVGVGGLCYPKASGNSILSETSNPTLSHEEGKHGSQHVRSDDNSHQSTDYEKEYKDSEISIQKGESRDTTVTFKRTPDLTFRQILKKIYEIQICGMDSSTLKKHSYKYKLRFDNWPILNGDECGLFDIKAKRDTFYVIETIYLDGTYYLDYGRDSKKLNIFKGVGNSYILGKDYSKDIVYQLIFKWQKDSLLKYGKEMMPPGRFNSGTHKTCASRVILSPTSVRIDMVKFYPLYGLKH